MTRRLAQILWLAALLLVATEAFPRVGSAHAGGPQLIVDAVRFVPGDRLEVRGANLGTDLIVRVELVADGKVIPLGEAVCDGHGDFAQTFMLPADLASGVYTLQVVDPGTPHAEAVMASTQLNVRTSGLSRMLGGNVMIALGLSTFVAVLLGVGLFLRKRQRTGSRVLKQPDARPR
ncbi:MAG: hypothetical protein M3R24_06030 [Chloroflexota bacterium]|nr:hypothetical protein [Chloroflexota bacterium]